jgi:hypothetical protein
MNWKFSVLYLSFSLLIFYSGKSQSVTGNWYGVGKVQMPGSNSTYLSELIINQKGKTITGFFNYYFRDSLFSNKISGTFNVATRKLIIHQFPIIYYKSTNTNLSVDCIMSGDLLLRVSRTESILIGDMVSSEDFKFTCPTIQFKLKKYIESADELNELDVIQNEQNQVIAKLDTPKPKPKSQQIFTEVDNKKIELYSKREKIFTKEIVVDNDKLKLEFYDNGAIDNDSISVFVNNKIILEKSKLDFAPIKLDIQLDESLPYNEISMFAENLGKIPPNTALLVIYDGNKRYDILLTSDFTKNATIKLISKKR